MTIVNLTSQSSPLKGWIDNIEAYVGAPHQTMAGGSITVKLGWSLVMAVVPPGALVPTGSALEQTLLQGMHGQISRKSRRE